MSTASLPWSIAEALLDGHAWRTPNLIESVQPALEYNTRTATRLPELGARITEPGEPISANALRCLATLVGLWVDRDACQPGEHPSSCRHREPWLSFTQREIALLTFGHDGNAQHRATLAALRELGSDAYRVLFFDPQRRAFGEEVSTILSFQRFSDFPAYMRPELPNDATCRIGWTEPIRERLLAGAYQNLPPEIVRALSGSAFYVWANVLLHPATYRLRVGEQREFAVGERATFQLRRLGLAHKNRPSKVRAALERAADAGNRVQAVWHLTVADAAQGGLKLRVQRVGARRNSVAIEARDVRQRGDAGTVETGRQPRQKEDAFPIKTAAADGFLETSIKTYVVNGEGGFVESYEDRSEIVEGEADRLAPLAGTAPGSVPVEGVNAREAAEGLPGGRDAEGWSVQLRADSIRLSVSEFYELTDGQRRLVEAIEARGIKAGCSLDEHLEVVVEQVDALRDGGRLDDGETVDPIEALVTHDDLTHPRRARM